MLLEWATSPKFTLLFAVARNAQRAVYLPGTDVLADSIALALDLLASSERSGVGRGAAAAVGSSLARLLFGGCEDLIASARTLLVAPDGPIHRVPFAALTVGGRPLVESQSIVVVPSGVVLAELRRRPQAASGAGMLAFDSGPKDGAGELRGARREVAWLHASFFDVEQKSAASEATSICAEDIARFDALHFAGHTGVDDESPWRSGIVLLASRELGVSASATGSGAPVRSRSSDTTSSAGPVEAVHAGYLTAERIARLPLAARLVVLASCESGRGGERAGEGLAGLLQRIPGGCVRAP